MLKTGVYDVSMERANDAVLGKCSNIVLQMLIIQNFAFVLTVKCTVLEFKLSSYDKLNNFNIVRNVKSDKY